MDTEIFWSIGKIAVGTVWAIIAILSCLETFISYDYTKFEGKSKSWRFAQCVIFVLCSIFWPITMFIDLCHEEIYADEICCESMREYYAQRK